MSKTVSDFRDELADREAIRDCIYRYCRAVDRGDEDLLRSVYWEDALDNHVAFEGTREELIAWVMPLLGRMDQNQHTVGNILIRINGSEANVESYFHGFHRAKDKSGTPRDHVGGGRYIDKFEKRNDEWRIAKRVVIMDWFREYDDSADWSNGYMGVKTAPGGRFPNDATHGLFASFKD